MLPIDRDGGVPGFEEALPAAARDVMEPTLALYASAGFEEPWICYFALRATEIVGTCGFTSAPRAGRVELAYYCFPPFEGQGVATAMARALLDIAQHTDPSVLVIARTLEQRGASHRILEKLGFQHTETFDDPEDGAVREWCYLRGDGGASRSPT